jgi:Uma2 family endonuclease
MQPLLLKRKLYEELIALPNGLRGEILNEQLYAHPRPSGLHGLVSSNLHAEINSSYHRGRGGPGGWWIIYEPEVHFQLDQEVLVPDIAGWRRERLPEIPVGHKFTVAADWVCEVLSPSTESLDREIKMPIYAKYDVKDVWLVDPLKRVLETYNLDNNKLELQNKYERGDTVSVKPFELLQFVLKELWE